MQRDRLIRMLVYVYIALVVGTWVHYVPKHFSSLKSFLLGSLVGIVAVLPLLAIFGLKKRR
jgi:hypothetical protein